MKITFDSNVWEKVVNEEEHHLVEIKNRILDGTIQAYICKIALSVESIQNKERPKYFRDYEPNITVTQLPSENEMLSIQVCIAPNTDLHPGLHPKLKDNLLKARDLGFQVLGMTNLATVRPEEIPDDMDSQHADSEEYSELLARCSDFIAGLGCGRSAYDQFKEQFNLVIPDERERKFSKAIAEWVDGDALSAHYAAGNDFFCTNDKARNAGTGSIFHKQNRIRLEKEFGIKIISSCELAYQIGFV